MKQKVLLVKTSYDKGFILDMPLEDAVKIIDCIKPVELISGDVNLLAKPKQFEFIIYTEEAEQCPEKAEASTVAS